jgi:hypothetical protein
MSPAPYDGGETMLDEDLRRLLLASPLPALDGIADTIIARSHRRTRLAVAGTGFCVAVIAVAASTLGPHSHAAHAPATSLGSSAASLASPVAPSPTESTTVSTSDSAATPTKASPRPTPPPVKVLHVNIGTTITVTPNEHFIVGATSLCLVEPHGVKNCGWIRNGNTGPGSVTEEGSGNQFVDIYYGIGDVTLTSASVERKDGTFVPVTLIRPIGDTWTAYFAVGSPYEDTTLIWKAGRLVSIDRNTTLRFYDARGLLPQAGRG